MTESPILFFSPGACSFGSIVALEWAGIPYRLCSVDKAQRQTPEFKRINPLAAVPAYKAADGHTLTENAAILQHIAAQNPAAKISAEYGSADWDRQNYLISLFSSGFHVAFYPYFMPQRYIGDEKLMPEVKDFAVKNIRAKYEQVNTLLEGRDYFIGNKPTIVDAYFFGMSRWGAALFNIGQDFPNIARFEANLAKEPAVQFALAAEKQDSSAKPTGRFEGFVELSSASARAA